MALITFKIRIKADGKPEVDLPEDLPVGEQVESAVQADENWENQPLTEDEIDEFLTFKGLTGAEIGALGLLGGWENKGIRDGAAWIQEQRIKRAKERNIRW